MVEEAFLKVKRSFIYGNRTELSHLRLRSFVKTLLKGFLGWSFSKARTALAGKNANWEVLFTKTRYGRKEQDLPPLQFLKFKPWGYKTFRTIENQALDSFWLVYWWADKSTTLEGLLSSDWLGKVTKRTTKAKRFHSLSLVHTTLAKSYTII